MTAIVFLTTEYFFIFAIQLRFPEPPIPASQHHLILFAGPKYPLLNLPFGVMYFFSLAMAYCLSIIVNAIPYISDGPEVGFTGIVPGDPNGFNLANADAFNDQSDFNSQVSGPKNTDLFSESNGYFPNEEIAFAFEGALLPDLDESTLLLANSGVPTDDQIKHDLFSGDSSDAAGSGLDGPETTFEIGTSEINIGPCNENTLNLCCTDSRYQNEVDPENVFEIVYGCAVCKFHHFTFFLARRCFFPDFRYAQHIDCSTLVGSASTTGTCSQANAKRFCCMSRWVRLPLSSYVETSD